MPNAYPSIARLDHVQLLSPDPKRLASFYCSALGLQPDKEGGVYEGPERALLFAPGNAGELGFGAFGFETDAELAARKRSLLERGVELAASPSPLFGSPAFALKDPDGNTIVFGKARQRHQPPDLLRARLQHLVVTSPDPERLSRFYTDIVGFWPSDQVVDDEGKIRAIWLRSDEEHHSFAIFRADTVSVDHHSYELADWNGIRDWADRFAAQKIELIWGPGRHGPGNNLFLFIRDPDGNKIELSAELERVPVHRPIGTWRHDRWAFNLWGAAPLRVA